MSKMQILYKSKGRAGEYAEGAYSLNIFGSCRNKCVYCFVPLVRKISRDVFFREPAPYRDVIKRLKHDIKIMRETGSVREVFMSFTSDPLQDNPAAIEIVNRCIFVLGLYNIPYNILTKAGHELFNKIADVITPSLCTVGSTLVFSSDADCRKYEPGAAVTSDRIEMLKVAKFLGCKTWVSLEPVWEPKFVYDIISRTKEFVDVYKIGKLNYHPHAAEIDWKAFAINVVDYCEREGVNYVLKEDLKKYMV